MDQIFGPKKDLTSKLNDNSKKEDGENGGRASIVEEDYSGLTLFLSLCVPSLQILYGNKDCDLVVACYINNIAWPKDLLLAL